MFPKTAMPPASPMTWPRRALRVTPLSCLYRRPQRSQLIIQGTPKRSRQVPNPWAQKFGAKGRITSPRSDSRRNR